MSINKMKSGVLKGIVLIIIGLVMSVIVNYLAKRKLYLFIKILFPINMFSNKLKSDI